MFHGQHAFIDVVFESIIVVQIRTGSVPCDREAVFRKRTPEHVSFSWLSLATSEGGSQLWTRASSDQLFFDSEVLFHMLQLLPLKCSRLKYSWIP